MKIRVPAKLPVALGYLAGRLCGLVHSLRKRTGAGNLAERRLYLSGFDTPGGDELIHEPATQLGSAGGSGIVFPVFSHAVIPVWVDRLGVAPAFSWRGDRGAITVDFGQDTLDPVGCGINVVNR